MTRNTAELRALLSACRKSDLIACLDRLSAENARQQRSAQQRLRELEQQANGGAKPPQQKVEPAAQPPLVRTVSAACLREAEAQIELLTRKLAAAQAELRRCQTRLFAYERETLALRRENAEMEALCQKARACGITVEPDAPEPAATAQPPQTVEYPAQRWPSSRTLAVAERTGALRCTQTPGKLTPQPWTPHTRLERLAVQLMDRMDDLLRA